LNELFQPPQINGIIYIDAQPETCLENVRLRNLNGEAKLVDVQRLEDISLQYLQFFESAKYKE